jgi:hypothetical protein
MRYAFRLALVGLLVGSSVFADSVSSSIGSIPGDGKAHPINWDARQDTPYHGNYFNEHHRQAVLSYYWQELRSGSCPPGLAHTHDGCVPPTQNTKWRIGRPLPDDAIAYELHAELALQLPLPKAGYRYVRVETAVLLVQSGAIVVDAIDNSRPLDS